MGYTVTPLVEVLLVYRDLHEAAKLLIVKVPLWQKTTL